MKFILGGMLALAIAGSALLAKQEPDEKEKPKQEETKKPAEKPKADKPAKNEKPEKAEKPAKQQPDEKPQQKADKKEQKQDEKQQKADQKNNREESRTDNRGGGREAVQQTPSGGKEHGRGQRIPDDRFRASFGREHHFHVKAHRGDRNFEYGGYTFEVVEGWPAGWVFDDECYLELDGDDYYLVDVEHPELRVLVVIG